MISPSRKLMLNDIAPEGNFTTTSLANAMVYVAMVYVMKAHDPFGKHWNQSNDIRVKYKPVQKKNTIVIYSGTEQFKLF